MIEIGTRSQLVPPSLAFAPLKTRPCCLACFTAARIYFCTLSSTSARFFRPWPLAFPVPWSSSIVSLRPSIAAASLCQAMTAEASAGKRWASGQASAHNSVLAIEPTDPALVGGFCNHHDHSSQRSALMEQILLRVTLPSPRLPWQGHQVLPHPSPAEPLPFRLPPPSPLCVHTELLLQRACTFGLDQH